MKIEFLSITELANRWNVSRERVKAMVNHGLLPGTVILPSAGRFGTAVKIPLCEIMELETQWQVGSKSPKSPQRIRAVRSVAPRLEHFPELLTE